MYSARDIRNLKSQIKKRTFGGYDADDVDQKLAALAQEWENQAEARRMAEERVREVEDKLKHYEKVELALQEALETARDSARRTEEVADRKARLIVEEAELRAQRIIQEAEQERYGLRQDLSHLTNRQNEVAARLRSFLMSELEMLAQFQGEDPVGFIKLVAPDRSAEERTLPAPPAALAEADPGADEAEPPIESEIVAPVPDLATEADAPPMDTPEPEEAAMDAGEEAHISEAATPEATDRPAPASVPEEVMTPDTTEAEIAMDPPSAAPEASMEAEAPEPIAEPPSAVEPAPEGWEGVPSAEPTPPTAPSPEADATEAAPPASEPEGDKPRMPRSPWPDTDGPRMAPRVWPPAPAVGPPPPADTSAPPSAPAPPEAQPPASEPPAPPTATPNWTSPGAFPDTPPAAPSASESPGPGGWSLRSLVTGESDDPESKDQH
ncbi:MAG: DivIVA domain-containing protein, partial [Bacteroidota bacterium]